MRIVIFFLNSTTMLPLKFIMIVYSPFSLNLAVFKGIWINFPEDLTDEDLKITCVLWKSSFDSVSFYFLFVQEKRRSLFTDINFSWRLSRTEFLQFLLQATVREADSSCLFMFSSCLVFSVQH